MHTRPRYWPFYVAMIFLSFQYAFTIYIDSTYLSQFFSARTIEELYALGSIGVLFILIVSSSLIRRFGNFTCLFIGLLLECIVLISLSQTTNPNLIVLLFLLLQILPSLIWYSLDVFLEGTIPTEKVTGTVRSTYLALGNAAFVFSPLIVGIVVGANNYRGVYAAASGFVILTILLVAGYFNRSRITSFKEVDFGDSLRKFPQRESLTTIYGINFILQCFYTIMIIFVPIYLHQIIGFSWFSIGIIFTVMLIPFPVFEPILGRMFDKIHSERDTMIVGFLLLTLSCIGMFFFGSASVLVWAVLLFSSRVGASFVEVGSEYSFFKRVNDHDAGFISVFRTTSPVSYIIAPLLITGLTSGAASGTMFLALAGITAVGIPLAYKLKTLPRSALRQIVKTT